MFDWMTERWYIRDGEFYIDDMLNYYLGVYKDLLIMEDD